MIYNLMESSISILMTFSKAWVQQVLSKQK